MKYIGFSLLLSLLLLGASCGAPSDGGVYRSYDAGESWEQKTYVGQDGRKLVTISNANILSIEMNPEDSNIIYIGTEGSGMYKTLDGGESWSTTKVISGNVYDIEIDEQELNNIYIARDETILKSRDTGETWGNVYSDAKNSTVNDLVLDTTNHNILYAATGSGGIVKSTNYGDDWDLRLQIDGSIEEILMAPYDTNVLYARTTEGIVYTSTNGGEPIEGADEEETLEENIINSGWSELLTKEFKDEFSGVKEIFDIAMDPNDGHVIYMVSKRGLMRTSDATENWVDLTTLVGFQDKQNQSVNNITVVPGDSNTIYFTLGTAFHVSNDFGTTWKTLDVFPSVRTITGIVIDHQVPEVMYATTKAVKEKKGLISN